MDEELLRNAIANPRNMGEMNDADAVGTVGNADCGDMVRLWLKFTEKDGRKVIDRASFQSFGCQTAIAVASVATELLRGKSPEEARSLSAREFSAPLGPLPPMKIHCGQMVEGALRAALEDGASPRQESTAPAEAPASDSASGRTLADSFAQEKPQGRKIKVVPL
jgi:nitrogen fixation NifU-like protein